MVKLKEVQNMFWGVTLDGGKRYTQTVERSFHISMAALESSAGPTKQSEKHVSVMIQHEKAEFVMCTLEYGRLFQQPLDLNFTEGEEVTFFLNGTGIVHLTGYLMEESQYDDEMQLSDMSEEDSDEEEAPELLQMESMDDEDDSEDEDYGKDTSKKKGVKKRKGKEAKAVKVKKAKIVKADESDDDDDDDSDDDDDDSDDMALEMRKLLEGEDLDNEDDSGDDDDEDEDDEDEDDEEEEQKVKSHKNKKQEAKIKEEPKTPIKKEKTESASQNKTPGQNGIASTPGSEEKKKKKKKKKKKNKDGQETQNSTEQSTPSRAGTDTPKKRVFAGGVIVEDLKIGHGPEAKSGRQVQMYYVGTLAQNGKQFDSLKGGKPFKFKLGKGEVIRGWDIGVNGMRVGGKRKLTIPPAMGYGKAKQGPIPPNSTLQFEVELKSVS